MEDADGLQLLGSSQADSLLRAAVRRHGGQLADWRLDHVDNQPGRSTTATYLVTVVWPWGTRAELLGCSVRAGGPDERDRRAEVLDDGTHQVACWIHPADPDLPGLARAAFPDRVAELVNQHGLAPVVARGQDLVLQMVTYRPRRRAVLRLDVAGRTFFLKALRAGHFEQVLTRHRLLEQAAVGSPKVVAATDDQLLVLAALPGEPLARTMFAPQPPCTAEQVVELLDALPAEVSRLERRAPWTDSVAHYARIVAAALPAEQHRLDWLVHQVQQGLAGCGQGEEPTHGDLHEGQLHTAGGRICGLLDVDTIGPGRRVDDLACLLAHLCTVQRMDARQAERVRALVRDWVPVFDERVDPVELRLRAAGAVVSLATGPHRGQEPHWQAETQLILDAAEELVRQVR